MKNCIVCYCELNKNTAIEINKNGIVYTYCADCAPKPKIEVKA